MATDSPPDELSSEFYTVGKPKPAKTTRWLVVLWVCLALIGAAAFTAALISNPHTPTKPSASPSPLSGVTPAERLVIKGTPLSASTLDATNVIAVQADIGTLAARALTIRGQSVLQGDLGVGGNAKITGNLTAANFTGSGAGVTNVDAVLLNGRPGTYYANLANLTGTLSDAQLSGNVALRTSPNTFTAANTFSGPTTISTLVLNAPLSVSSGGTGLQSIPAQGVVYGQGSGAVGVAVPATAGQCLLSTATLVQFGSCSGGAAGVDSVNGLTGIIGLSNSSNSGNTLVIDNASTIAKGIASFNATNFSVVGGAVNTVQNLAVGSTPTFAGLTLSAPLPVSSGGTGAASLTTGGVVIGQGSGAFVSVTAGSAGQCLISTVGSPAFAACPGGGGVVSVNSQSGVLTVANATAAGGTITINDATTVAKGLSSFNTNNFVVASGAVNTIQNIAVTSTPTFANLNLSSALSVLNGGTGSTTAAGARTNLGAAAAGANSDITSLSSLTTAITTAQGGTGVVSTPSSGQVLIGTSGGYSLNTLTAGSGITITNASGSITISSPSGGSCSTCATTSLSNLVGVAINTSLLPASAASASLGSTALPFGQLALAGSSASPATNNFLLTGVSTSGTRTLTLPDASGTIAVSAAGPIALDALGNITCPTCLTSGGGGGTSGVSSLNTATGALTLQGVSAGSIGTSGTTITINDATAAVKGLASFNATNFTVTTGNVNTIQDIATTSTPTFGALNLSSALSLGNGGTGATTGPAARTALGAAAKGANSDITSLSNLSTALSVGQGGTGATTLASGVVLGNATSALTSVTGSNGQCLIIASGVPVFSACTGSGGVTSLNSQSGVLTLANASASAGTITIQDATSAAKGIASFNATNLTVTTGSVNTVQDIAVGATPLFAGLSLTSALTLANGGTGATSAGSARINLGAAVSGANGDITSLTGLTTALSTAQGGTGIVASPTNGQVLIGNASGFSLNTLTAGSGIAITNGTGTVTISAAGGGSCSGCATTALSNLSSVAINASLLPAVAAAVNLGSTSLPFGQLSLAGTSATPATNNFLITGASTGGTRTLSLPDESGTLCVQNSSNCGFITGATADGSYVQLQVSTPGTAQTGNLNISGTAIIGTQITAPIIKTGIIRPTSDGVTALQVQNAAGTATVFAVDTTNSRLSLGNIGTPSGQLYVGGSQPAASSGSTATGSTTPHRLVVQGNYAYIAATNAGTAQFRVFDVSSPLAPLSVGSLSVGSNDGIDLAIAGRYGYMAVPGDDKLYVIDTANPSAPAVIGSASISTGSSTAVGIQGRYAFVLAGATIQSFDVSNPSAPVSIATVSLAAGASAAQLNINGRYAYIVNAGTSNSLQIIDISNAATLTSLSTTALGSSGPTDIKVVGRYAYVVTSGGNQLKIIDIKNPNSPSVVGTLSLTASGAANSIFVQGHYAYIASAGTANTYQVVDISTPSAPVSVGTTGAGTSVKDVDVVGRYLYGINADGTIKTFDIGGAYLQQLEAGGISTTTLSTQELNVTNEASFGAGLNVSGSSHIFGDLAVGGYVRVNHVSGSSASLLVVDAALTASLPAASAAYNGAIVYDSSLDRFKVIEGGIYKTLCNKQDSDCASILQDTYNNSPVVSGATSINLTDAKSLTFTAADTTTDPSVIVNLQCTTCSANGGVFAVQNAGANVFTVNPNGGSIVAKNSADSATAFQIQNSSSNPVFTVDTSSSSATLGKASTLTGQLSFANTTAFTSTITGNNAATASYSTVLPAAVGTSGQCLSLSSVVSTVQTLGYAACSGGGGGANVTLSNLTGPTAINTDLTFANGANRTVTVAQAGSGLGNNLSLIAGQSATGVNNGGNLVLQAGATGGTGTTGSAIIQANGTDSAAAFQVQNASGSSALTVDTTSLNALISNSSFEAGTTGWYAAGGGTGASIAISTTQKYIGSQSLAFTTGTAVGNSANYTIGTGLSTSTTYTLSFYAKAGTAMSSLSASYSPDGTVAKETDCATFSPSSRSVVTTGWTRYTCTINTPATAANGSGYIAIKQSDATSRILYLDGVQIEAGSAITRAVVSNTGFEVSAAGWSALGAGTAVQSAADKYNGSDSLLITTPNTANTGAKYVTANTNPTQLTFSTTYILSFWAKAKTTPVTSLTAAYAYDGATETNCTLNSTTISTSAWAYYTCTFTTFAITPLAGAYIAIKQSTAAGIQNWYVDDVQLTDASLIGTPSAFKETGIALNGVVSSPTSFKNQFDSTTALQIQNTTGTSLFNVDTLANKISLSSSTVQIQNAAGTAVLLADTLNLRINIGTNGTPTGQLYVAGQVPSAATGSVSTAGAAKSVYVQGRYAYVANSSTNKMGIYDISNPAAPASVGSVSTGTAPWSVFVQGHYAFITNSGSDTMTIYDISNPSSPTGVGSVATGSTPYSVYVQGRYAYVVNAASSKLQIFDVSNPAAPTSVGSVFLVGNSARSVYVQGRYAYITVANNDVLQVIDVTNPVAPASVGTVSTGAGSAPYSVYVQGRYAYVANSNTNTLGIYDVSIPATPSSVGSVATGTSPQTVFVQGRYAYVANFAGASDNMGIYDVSSPASPTSVGTVTTVSNPESVYVQGRYAYVIVANGSLKVFDVGGAYTQQLEAGGIDAGSISATNALAVGTNASIGGGLQVAQGAEINGSLGVTGRASFISEVNSTTAFQIQNSAGTSNLLVADTSGNTITLAGSNLASTINIGSAGTNTSQIINIGSNTTTNNSKLVLNSSSSAASSGVAGVFVGNDVTDASQVNLQLDSSNVLADAGTCSATVNQGALYYNTASSEIRTCNAGTWSSVLTASGIGLIAYGVVDNSGAGAGAGDLAALGTAGASGPCKVSWASTTTVSVAACTAYSAGRKVVVPNAVVLTLTTTTANLYESVCLSGVNGAPALVGPAATITSSTIMPAFSQSAPVACLAILKNSSTVNGNFTGAAQGQIYDIRTFTSTTKEFQTASTAVAPGMLAQLSGTGVVPSAAAAGTGSQYGIVLMSDGSTSTTTPNAIVAVDGPAYVLATAGTAGQLVESGPTTAGYAATLANPLNSAITGNSQYTWVGQARTNFAAGCTSAATCLGSLYVVVNIH